MWLATLSWWSRSGEWLMLRISTEYARNKCLKGMGEIMLNMQGITVKHEFEWERSAVRKYTTYFARQFIARDLGLGSWCFLVLVLWKRLKTTKCFAMFSESSQSDSQNFPIQLVRKFAARHWGFSGNKFCNNRQSLPRSMQNWFQNQAIGQNQAKVTFFDDAFSQK